MASSILQLPDDLLNAIVARLTQNERLGTAALVCRRWHGIAHSPQLLTSLAFSVQLSAAVRVGRGRRGDRSPPPPELSRIQSFAAFLRRHASAVRCLRIDVGTARVKSDESHLEAADLLNECVRACAESGGGSLLSCRLDADLGVQLGYSLGELTSLTELSIEGVTSLGVSLAPLANCTRLELLQTRPAGWQRLPAGVQLPPALTHLTYGVAPGQRPYSVAYYLQLPALRLLALAGTLRSLELRGNGATLESGSMPVVSRLTALTALRLHHFANLPRTLRAALPALRQLQVLHLSRLRESGELFSQEGEWPEGPQHPSPLLGPSSELGPVLGQLTGLTSLVVSDVVACQLYNQAPPRELAALTRLQHLHYVVYGGGECPGGMPPNAWCPQQQQQQQQGSGAGGSSGGGAGASSPLTWLALEDRLLHASRAWLEGPGAAALRELHIKWAIAPDAFQPGGRDFGHPRWSWFWRWAAAHPALHTLTFDVGSDEDVPPPAGWEEACAELAAARPGLRLRPSDFERLLPGPL